MVSEAGRVNPVSVQAASPSCAFQLGLLCGCTPAPRLKPLRRHSWGQGATWWHATSQGRDGMLWSGQEAADSQRPLVSAGLLGCGQQTCLSPGPPGLAADFLLGKLDPRPLLSKDPPTPTQPSETSWQWAQPQDVLSCGLSLAGSPHP